MRLLAPIQAVSAVASITLLAVCSNGVPIQSTPMARHVPVDSRENSELSVGNLASGRQREAGYNGASYNACPATGLLVYVSDDNDSTVNIFSGDLSGQAPCGIIFPAA